MINYKNSLSRGIGSCISLVNTQVILNYLIGSCRINDNTATTAFSTHHDMIRVHHCVRYDDNNIMGIIEQKHSSHFIERIGHFDL